MYEASIKEFEHCDGGILAAAVADYRPKIVSDKKIKKSTNSLTLELEKTIDIAASLGKVKRKDQLLVGFALETNNEKANAEAKLKKKNFDFIVLNSLNDQGAGFNHDTNKISIIHKGNKIKDFKLKTKKAVAIDIVDEITEFLNWYLTSQISPYSL